MVPVTSSDTPVSTDRVELEVPADPAYLAVLRTATAGLAARMDLTLDEIEDLRIAVDEACALLLGVGGDATYDRGAGAGPQTRAPLRAAFDLGDDVLQVRVTGPATTLPERSSFAWAVLEALVGQIDTESGEGSSTITLRHRRVRRA